MNNLPVGIALGSVMNGSSGEEVLSYDDFMIIVYSFTVLFIVLSIISHLLMEKLDYYECLDFSDMVFKSTAIVLITFLILLYFVKLVLFLFGN